MTRSFACLLVLCCLCACGEKFPGPWDKLGLPTDGLFSAFTDSDKPAVTGLYKSEVKLDAIVAGWDSALTAKGYKRFCETVHDDGSLNRGYENEAEKSRYLFTGGLLGDTGPELRLLEVPSQVSSDEVCPPKG